MFLDLTQNTQHNVYSYLVGGISPRPIAWVSTLSKEGVANIAPYSFFTVASCNPPVLSVTQVNPRDKANKDHIILLSEGRLVNLGNATGHPSRIMDGSFANQVLAQIHLFNLKFADLSAEEKAAALTVEVLPKKLDEEVAAHMVAGFGGVLTKLTQQQADYIGVSVDGPFKPESYKY